MWGSPLQGYTENGEKLNVILVDSEGMGGLDEDNNHDSRIFTLAMLLSSFMIYNSMGSIDENALSNLGFVTQIARHIVGKTQDQEDDYNFMPKFMWVVRDFSLALEDSEGNPIDSKQYLEKAL